MKRRWYKFPVQETSFIEYILKPLTTFFESTLVFAKRQNKFVRILLCLSLSPIILVGCLGFLFYVCLPLGKINLSRRWDELWLKMKMGWKKRTISEKSLIQRIATGLEPGTFIQESYGLAYPRVRIWWTPDTISTLGKIPFGPGGSSWNFYKEVDPFQRWLYETYADQKKGKALLLIARARTSTPGRLQLHFPTIPQVALWSGPVLWQLKIHSESLKLHTKDATSYYNRAISHRENGNILDAITDYTRAIELDATFEKAYFNRGCAYNKIGQYDHAETDFKKCVELEPCKPAGYNGLAWLYATCPDERFRNGNAAIEWAQKAFHVSEGKVKKVYDTIAAAFAELGDFDVAVEWEQRYLGLDLTPAEAEAGQKRLELYNARQPYRQEASS
jgi:Tfp pilus assembly protein PilF